MAALTAYYNRFNGSKNYESHMFRAGYVLQAAELNEMQARAAFQSKSIGDALFKDGDVVRDARLVVNEETGAVTCESGAIYLRGEVRGVPPGQFNIPVVGTILVGVYLQETIVTEVEDPELNDPATQTANYGEAGAARLRVDPVWGYQGDGQIGDFFPIYYVDEGVQRAKEAPPTLDTVSQAIARYDRDSTGSNYVVSGMRVQQLANSGANQVYDLAEGRARVNGQGIELYTSRRISYAAEAVLQFIDSEPKSSTTLSLQRINVDRPPIKNITGVRITRQKVDSIVHSTVSGGSDPLSETSVVDITSVVQGGTTYVKGVDFQLTAGQVDWSLSGAEPAPGSTYSATFHYISSVSPQDQDAKGFSVLGAVPGTLVLTSYNTMLPRIDRLCLDDTGQVVFLEGVSTPYNPVRPQVPSNMLALAQIFQTWDEGRYVINDGVRVVPMNELEEYGRRMDLMTDMIAQVTLKQDASAREAIAKKGLFTDPFIDDSMRDAGVPQTASSADGTLSLPIAATAYSPSADVAKREVCAFELETILQSTARTGTMKVNPYMAFDIMPADVTLTPSVDRWQEEQTVYASPVTNNFTVYDPGWHGANLFYNVTTEETRLLASKSTNLKYLRQIEVRFVLEGFGPNELLSSVTFDGIPVTPTAA